ncbi:MAG: hypothetical protein J0H68_08165 [Sphingobacteriia bacterium]|nr:hypothetical protein [Sphingobacteriia bacterium]
MTSSSFDINNIPNVILETSAKLVIKAEHLIDNMDNLSEEEFNSKMKHVTQMTNVLQKISNIYHKAHKTIEKSEKAKAKENIKEEKAKEEKSKNSFKSNNFSKLSHQIIKPNSHSKNLNDDYKFYIPNQRDSRLDKFANVDEE